MRPGRELPGEAVGDRVGEVRPHQGAEAREPRLLKDVVVGDDPSGLGVDPPEKRPLRVREEEVHDSLALVDRVVEDGHRDGLRGLAGREDERAGDRRVVRPGRRRRLLPGPAPAVFARVVDRHLVRRGAVERHREVE